MWLTCVVHAADHAGRYALKGAGLLPCGLFATERDKRSEIYYLAAGWVEGYISAFNRHTADTFDVVSFESTELLLLLVHGHCKARPNARLYSVVDALLLQVAPQRLTQHSDRVRIESGERAAQLYTEVVRRMQAELKRRGLYKGEVDGRFSEDTRSALIAFQSDIAFDKTGFPDQTTLWRLMHDR